MPVTYPVSDPLGVLVCRRPGDPPFAESRFLRKLMLTGSRAGLRVFAFDPGSWRSLDDTVQGWTPEENGGWRLDRYPVPEWVYDRAWPENEEERVRFRRAVLELAGSRKLRYVNGKVPGKWQVYSVLSRYPEIAPYLPPTAKYAGEASLLERMEGGEKPVFLKPVSGSQGRRTAACSRAENGAVRIRGRSGRNRPFDFTVPDAQQAARTLHRWIGSRSYIMQPFLDLSGPEGEPFDIRVLVQKNARGLWAVTGAAARRGHPGAVTANLHGGGTALPADLKLREMHGPRRSAAIMKEIRQACIRIVRRLEQHFGRFCELGLDFGVERDGRIWFLEANSKPGRCAMAAVSAAAAEKAAARPILYAKSILLRPPGRVIHEFDHL